MRMWIYILRRLILLVPVIIGVMTITFVLISALPVQQRLSSQFGQAPQRAPWIYEPLKPCPENPGQECRNPTYYYYLNKLGLNKPVPEQWGIYIFNSFTLNWGTVGNGSTAGATFQAAQGQPVATVLSWFLPYTLELAALSLAIILAIAIPLGNLAAVNRNRPVDQSARILSFSGYALPTFLLSSLALMVAVIGVGAGTGFFNHTPWCPAGETTWQEFTGSWPAATSGCFGLSPTLGNNGYPSWLVGGFISHPTGFPTIDALIHGQTWLAADTLLRILIPAAVIAFAGVAGLLRFVRNSMLEVMNLDFVRTARAEGIPENTVVKRHAGRNSLNVTITVLGLTFAAFIGGFPIIEDVFKLNGVGLILALSVQATHGIDFGLVFGATLLFTIIVVLANIIVDVLYAYLDPRVRLG
jgi:peptide/nickel transport system permease protein